MLLVTGTLAAPAVARRRRPRADGRHGRAPQPDPAMVVAPNVLLGRVAEFSGTLPARGRADRHDRAARRGDRRVGRDRERTRRAGRALRRDLEPDVTGRVPTRATVAAPVSPDAAETAFALAAPVEALLTVYRPANATWFGPGFYGRRTACGLRMSKRLLGVAHKRLPCGTMVAFTYKGRAITVPVVDRGPFTKGRAWDLTSAAAKALGFAATGRLGAIPLG